MEFIVVCLVALCTSALTLFSGFGLGTLLLPAFLIFFPVDLAVAMTAIVHFLNNVFKVVLLGKNANMQVVAWFGVPAVIAAFSGAAVLFLAAGMPPLAGYQLFGKVRHLTVVKLLMALLIIAFAILDVMPSLRRLEFNRKFLPLGGLLSGFFGGISGHQGALRSAFLLRAGLPKESFIATGVVIACLVDVTRLGVYARHLSASGMEQNIMLLVTATLCAFLGAFLGNKLVKKITMRTIQNIVVVVLVVIALGLGSGLF